MSKVRISIRKEGAHNPALIREPNSAEIHGWTADSGILLVTLAPELPGAHGMIEQLAANGVLVSAGHSLATFSEATAGFAAGIRYGTHLFNAMPPLHHREPGLAGALLADERVTIGLIPDGVHVHPGLIRVVREAAGDRLNLVTDAMGAMAMPPGVYELGTFSVTVDEQRATLADGTLAGSIVTMDAAVRNLWPTRVAVRPMRAPHCDNHSRRLARPHPQRPHRARSRRRFRPAYS